MLQLPIPINRARGGPFTSLSLSGILGLLGRSTQASSRPPLQGNFPTMPSFTVGSYLSSELSGSSSGSKAPSRWGGSLSTRSSRASSAQSERVRNKYSEKPTQVVHDITERKLISREDVEGGANLPPFENDWLDSEVIKAVSILTSSSSIQAFVDSVVYKVNWATYASICSSGSIDPLYRSSTRFFQLGATRLPLYHMWKDTSLMNWQSCYVMPLPNLLFGPRAMYFLSGLRAEFHFSDLHVGNLPPWSGFTHVLVLITPYQLFAWASHSLIEASSIRQHGVPDPPHPSFSLSPVLSSTRPIQPLSLLLDGFACYPDS